MNLKKTQPKKIRVNLISESEFTVQGHGVHTAFVEMKRALSEHSAIELSVNSKQRDFDIVHVHTVGLFSLRRLLSAKGKKVITAHLVPDSFIGSLRGAIYWKPLARLWLKLFYRQGDLVVGCSAMVRDELHDDMGLQHVDLLYNTIDMRRYDATPAERVAARKKLGLDKNDFVVVGNGQVQPRKRLDTFFAIAKAMPDAKFFWVGGTPFGKIGAEYEKMQKLVKEAPENVTMTGLIPLEEVRDYYTVADTFVLPASQENHPMCVLEAAGANLPIVLRDIPQYSDSFKGHAIMASTDTEFVSAVRNIRNDAAFREEALAGSRRIRDRFDSRHGAELAVAFYRQLLEK
ncbi:MAG TPA: glycosyltransferase family 4 protein [Candidatus Saccharibacteria bacterium]|nr:glycosyltransferase family 4 protein [Candidatus Saccharibacteria bacterium]HMR38378.1 glycosyltransferase family 4 protein [Candidatus Saccharibacteria bacterium]